MNAGVCDRASSRAVVQRCFWVSFSVGRPPSQSRIQALSKFELLRILVWKAFRRLEGVHM